MPCWKLEVITISVQNRPHFVSGLQMFWLHILLCVIVYPHVLVFLFLQQKIDSSLPSFLLMKYFEHVPYMYQSTILFALCENRN
jgi:hypothetical protein